MKSTDPRQFVARAVAVGAFSGILSGLFGVGGGIVLVPALLMVVGLDARKAAATSLAAVIPISMAGLAGYAMAGQVDWLFGVIILVGALGGLRIGAHLLRRLPERTMLMAFAALLLLVSVRMLFSIPPSSGPVSITVAAIAGGVVLGFSSGILSGLFGVGGGFVIVPAMVLLLSEPATLAKGSSLLVVLPTAVFGTWFNHQADLVDHRTALATGLSGALFSFLSAQVAVGLDEHVANVSFAVLLLLIAIRMTIAARRVAVA